MKSQFIGHIFVTDS